jgi:hypothetical protein
MIRRYLVAFVGAVVGGGFALLAGLLVGRIFIWLVIICALGLAGALMAFGERLGLIPPSEEIGKPTSLFSDDDRHRR